jgi:hypothetical protein
MLPELQLTPTDLQLFDDLKHFPSPPESLMLYAQNNAPWPDSGIERLDEERSWFFYLAELSIRRTINDVLGTFYDKTEQQWIDDIDLLCRQFDESDKQISLWLGPTELDPFFSSFFFFKNTATNHLFRMSHLPPLIQFNGLQQPENELVYFLQGRLEEWRELIHRPFLYFYLHHSPSMSATPRILSLARREVEMCAALIERVACHGRHGGTWLLVRRSWRCAMMILGVVIRNGEVEPPKNWKELVGTSLMTITKWMPESPDLRSMGIVLDSLYRTICGRICSEPVL